MLMEDVLAHPARVLTEAQRQQFFEDGCLVAEGLLDGGWLERLHAAMEANVEASRGVTRSDERFVLESGHGPHTPRLRRLSSPVSHHADFWAFASESVSADVAADLCAGPASSSSTPS